MEAVSAVMIGGILIIVAVTLMLFCLGMMSLHAKINRVVMMIDEMQNFIDVSMDESMANSGMMGGFGVLRTKDLLDGLIARGQTTNPEDISDLQKFFEVNDIEDDDDDEPELWKKP
jgi:hypothetical protein